MMRKREKEGGEGRGGERKGKEGKRRKGGGEGEEKDRALRVSTNESSAKHQTRRVNISITEELLEQVKENILTKITKTVLDDMWTK